MNQITLNKIKVFQKITLIILVGISFVWMASLYLRIFIENNYYKNLDSYVMKFFLLALPLIYFYYFRFIWEKILFFNIFDIETQPKLFGLRLDLAITYYFVLGILLGFFIENLPLEGSLKKCFLIFGTTISLYFAFRHLYLIEKILDFAIKIIKSIVKKSK